MSNRLYAQDKQHVEVPFDFDSLREQRAVLSRAEALRGEATIRLIAAAGRMIAAACAEIKAAFAEFSNSVARARTAQELSTLDDRILADIGISRSDIPAFVAGQIDSARAAIANDRAKRPDETRTAA